jgi:uncharacterized delta-60 repeat protein
MRSIKNSLTGVLGGWTKSRRGSIVKPRPSRRLLLQLLEDRTMPSAGMLDPSFGVGGQVTRAVGGWGNGGYMAMQADGKIVQASSYFTGTHYLLGGDYVIEAARFQADGSADDSFGTNGLARITIGVAPDQPSFTLWGIAQQPQLDGTEKTVLVGSTENSSASENHTVFGIYRLNADGELDTTFNNNIGRQTIDFGMQLASAYAGLAVHADGRIVVAGSSSEPGISSEFAVARLNGNGTLDTSFADDGLRSFGFEGFQYATAQSLALQPDGKIVVAGYAQPPEFGAVLAVARLDSGGNLDDSFGASGKRTVAFEGFDHSTAASVVVQADGKVVLAGQGALEGGSEAIVARLNGDGTPDDSFGPNGQQSFKFGAAYNNWYDSASSLAVQPDGKLVVAGFSHESVPDFEDGTGELRAVFGLARINNNGTLDQTFGAAGKQTIAFPGAYSFARGLALLPDGQIVAGGQDGRFPNPSYALARVLGQDRDNDGLEDSLQTNLAAVLPAVPQAQYSVTLAIPAGTTLVDVAALPAPPPEQAPEGAEFPVGAFQFTVEGVEEGGTAPVILYMPPGVPVNAYYKLNPATDQWELFEGAAFEDRNGDGTLDIVLTLTDGGSGDADGEVNGRIVDPGLPAYRSAVQQGQTATIGFWQNANGQNLIKSLNGGPSSTHLGDWLAATLPNLYGINSGANNLTGKTNAEVAALYVALFNRTGGASGPPKLDAQVLALALAVYVTNQNLAGATAVAYGFQVTATGVGTATFDVGDANRAAFNLEPAQTTVLTVLDILGTTDALSHDGLLYDVNDSGTIDKLEKALRVLANSVFTAINQQGDI